MPFPKQESRVFTRQNVEALKPNQIGCYGLHHKGWVYVGKGDIRQRLLDHLNGDNPCITRERPTHWVDVVCNDSDTREKNLIIELNPTCNRRVG